MTSRTHIVSTGMFVPPTVYTNKDLEKLMDTSDEWIQQRSGIKERRWVKPGDGCSILSMAADASKQAINKAGIQVDDIDCVIFGTLMSDHIFPGTGCLLQAELGFSKPIPALDIRNQCSGFVYAMSIADAWIRCGMYKRILIVASEIHSTSLDISTRGRDISVLFGDGAGAMIVEASEEAQGNFLIDSELHTEGQHAKRLFMSKPSPNDHPRIPDNYQEKPLDVYPFMDGKYVFKHAVTRMGEVIKSICQKNNILVSDIDFLIPHQANLRINEMIRESIGLKPEQTHISLDRYGNTTMATIPITMHEALELNKIKKGDLVCTVAFGAGFTWGANLFRL